VNDRNGEQVTALHPSLEGRRILVTRSAEQSSEFRALLESRGASVLCFPTVEIADPDSWNSCDAAIWKIAEYSGVCFTSKNAVEKFLQRVRTVRPQALNTLGLRSIFAVGVKTRSALESAGLSVQALPSTASAEELARTLRTQELGGRRFLFPKSNIAGEILPRDLRSAGGIVDEVVVYKTVVPEPDNLEKVRSSLTDGKVDVVTFFSPSSARNFIEILGAEALNTSAVAVIGPTTAEAVKELGIEAAVIARLATAESLAQSIEEYFRTR
jgi:uroporphyrinogen III methyltransferase/synthase